MGSRGININLILLINILIKSYHNMITDNDQLDEFGFSLELNEVYPVEKKNR